MVYSNNLVVVVKCDGKLLRDIDSVVTLPFGSEYSLLLKNLSLQDVVLGIEIDGSDILSGTKLRIPAKESHEILGFFDTHHKITNRFKFIKKTEQIVNHRGDNIDDGFINISFQYVAQPAPVVTYYPPVYNYYHWDKSFLRDSYTTCDSVSNYTSSCSSNANTFGVAAACSQSNQIQKEEGLTVKGSKINQQYQTSSMPNLEAEKHNIILRLKGHTSENKIVSNPIFVKTKLECDTCGKKCKSHMKFCPNCGTSLI